MKPAMNAHRLVPIERDGFIIAPFSRIFTEVPVHPARSLKICFN
jgi:hypothetical protein